LPLWAFRLLVVAQRAGGLGAPDAVDLADAEAGLIELLLDLPDLVLAEGLRIDLGLRHRALARSAHLLLGSRRSGGERGRREDAGENECLAHVDSPLFKTARDFRAFSHPGN
jgi:hypothetical protein